ncbi:Crp/Fnr family transcriptional regulator [Flagellimonas algicola]|uniref:Crp/Fnr family transcriptional regulator n=1 Tax=Flagellimonas algicola TaxID=2583815 RepID=A0ABY2WPM9_9FLAO|nr:Crp/Fnr family transcriptional regulator [Allomuricauda algicola]TMU56944.1 Crp/Fnr family transcriptional regulator [Allomuricauda algicola]
MKEFRCVLTNLEKHIQLTPEEVNLFISHLHHAKLQKQETLLEQAAFCDAIYFVNEGMLRAFSLAEDGKEHTVMFATSDWWITDMFAFVKEQKSVVSIEALVPSSVLRLSKLDYEELLFQIPKLERFFRILMQNAYIREQRRSMENLALPAKEKYEIFKNRYPEISKQLNQKQIASYLGITPEFLSMIRNNS